MLNFTGLSRRRQVNMGNKGGPSNAGSFLERTRMQRQQREIDQKRLTAAKTIQSYIRRYLDCTRYATEVNDDILRNDGLFALRFQYLTRWKSQYAVAQFALLDDRLGELGPRDCEIILASLSQLAFQKQFLDKVIDAFARVLDVHKPANDAPLLAMAEALAAANVTSAAALRLLFRLLASPDLPLMLARESVASVLLDSGEFTADDVNSLWDGLRLAELDQPSLLRLLVTYLRLPKKEELERREKEHRKEEHTKPTGKPTEKKGTTRIEKIERAETSTTEKSTTHIDSGTSNTLESIIKHLNVPVIDDTLSEADIRRVGDVMEVGSSVISALERLYESEFVNVLVERAQESITQSSAVAALSSLAILLPARKNRLFLVLTVKNCYQAFFMEIAASTAFAKFIEDRNRDVLSEAEVVELLPDYGFWKNVRAFSELYNFWLLVANDSETFDSSKLNVDDAVRFTWFLRLVCLTTVYVKLFDSGFEALVRGLLRQLYLHNLRLGFLPRDFWVLRSVRFDISGLVRDVFTAGELHAVEMDVLTNMAFFIGFEDRVKCFHALIERERREYANPFVIQQSTAHSRIRREHVLDDAFKAFAHTGSSFKDRILVEFYSEDGGLEAGIDGGGLTKEFLSCVVEQGFDPRTGLFCETSQHEIYPDPQILMRMQKKIDVAEQEKRLHYIYFLGKIVGKCIFENVLIDVAFAPFFLKKFNSLNARNLINDLKYLDSDMYRSLMKLLHMSPDELALLELTFTVDELVDGVPQKFELIPDGEDTVVTTSNRLYFVDKMANFKLNLSLHGQYRAFMQGLGEMVSLRYLDMFDYLEVQMLISGRNANIDVADWKEHVEYGGYLENDVTVQYFWQVVEEFSPRDKAKLLKYVTSVHKAPLMGFALLSPRFGIRNAGRELDRLPTASTCVNLLKLPDYQDKEMVRKKLLYVINMDAGFDLS